MSKTKTTDLEADRDEITDKLAGLRMSPAAAEAVRQADKAVSAYRAEATALETRIDEIDNQIGVRERDRREAAAKERLDRWTAMREQLMDEEQTRLKDIEDAETATRALVDAINRTLVTNARMAKIAQELSQNGKVPMSLSATDLTSRLGGRIAGLMATVEGHRGRLGAIQWQGGSLYPAERSWRDDEEKFMAAQLLQPLLEKGYA